MRIFGVLAAADDDCPPLEFALRRPPAHQRAERKAVTRQDDCAGRPERYDPRARQRLTAVEQHHEQRQRRESARPGGYAFPDLHGHRAERGDAVHPRDIEPEMRQSDHGKEW